MEIRKGYAEDMCPHHFLLWDIFNHFSWLNFILSYLKCSVIQLCKHVKVFKSRGNQNYCQAERMDMASEAQRRRTVWNKRVWKELSFTTACLFTAPVCASPHQSLRLPAVAAIWDSLNYHLVSKGLDGIIHEVAVLHSNFFLCISFILSYLKSLLF